ncbi:site-specific DNA-methyltransferase [Corticibacterium sp. UT-5YL-CI-8]|nr:site-specific DNA-methyltransferase [Tianweitania sp. UT-5YL-CI-8]
MDRVIHGTDMIDVRVTQIVNGDAVQQLDRMPDSSVQLCVTSPPYNIGKSYEKSTNQTLEQYSQWMRSILTKISRKLKSGGSICLQVGNYVKDGIIVPLDYIFYPILMDLGLSLRNRIIWRYNFGLHAKHRLSGRYEVILWVTKGLEYKFNLDPIRIPQLYPGKRHAARKVGKAGMPSGNPMGKNPSDYWEFSAEKAFFGEPVWDIPNVKSKHPEKTEHPCQFPNELVERCVLAFTDKGDLVLDPFAGTGTSVICADIHGRVGVGIELLKDYADNARSRLQLSQKGELALRPSGIEPRLPKETERVATVPTEWLRKQAV